jgi:hypothetical protein
VPGLREQPKIPDCTRDYLAQAEDEAKERKANKQSELWWVGVVRITVNACSNKY